MREWLSGHCFAWQMYWSHWGLAHWMDYDADCEIEHHVLVIGPFQARWFN